MQYQSLFSGKHISVWHLLKILPRVLSINMNDSGGLFYQHPEKMYFLTYAPKKTQMSLVWSEFFLSSWGNLHPVKILIRLRMHRLIWIFDAYVRRYIFWGFICIDYIEKFTICRCLTILVFALYPKQQCYKEVVVYMTIHCNLVITLIVRTQKSV